MKKVKYKVGGISEKSISKGIEKIGYCQKVVLPKCNKLQFKVAYDENGNLNN